ncbi:MAG: leucine-rich repeat domain-containing protein, partial [Flavobacteriales bacterium]|nr:leucine-rich repeat domain-containing protein [Flavobacteriales bacterium]
MKGNNNKFSLETVRRYADQVCPKLSNDKREQMTKDIYHCMQSGETTLNLRYYGCDICGIFEKLDLSHIKYLNLEHNGLTRISGLTSLTELTRLCLDHNNISTINGLTSLRKLTTLGLSYNRITMINGLESLTALTELDLSYNMITKVNDLDTLNLLKVLLLSSNFLTTIGPLNNLTALTHIGCSSTVLKFPPQEIAAKGVIAIRQYWKDNYEGKIENISEILTKDLSEDDSSQWRERMADCLQFWVEKPDEFIENLQILINGSVRYSTHLEPPYVAIFARAGLLQRKMTTVTLICQPTERAKILYQSITASEKNAISDALDDYYDKDICVHILGNPRAGKTSLFNALSFQRGLETVPTIGVDILSNWSPVLPRDRESGYSASLFHYGGQRIQYLAHHLFLNKRSLSILVCSPVDDESNLTYWVSAIQSLIGDCQYFLLYNERKNLYREPTAEPTLLERFPPTNE